MIGKKLITLFFLFRIVFSGVGQTPELYFSHEIRPYDTLSFDSSIQILKGKNVYDTLMEIPFEFKWFDRRQTKIIFASAFRIPTCTQGSINGETFSPLQARFITKKKDSINLYTPSIRYQIKGPIGKRVIVTETKNLATKYSPSDKINFQYRIYEEDNHVEFQYGKIDVLDWSKLDEDTFSILPTPDITYPQISCFYYWDCNNWENTRIAYVIDTNNTWELNTYKWGDPNFNATSEEKYIKRIPPLGTTFIFKQGVLNSTNNKETLIDEIKVFPNPNNGNFMVKNIEVGSQLKVFDISGKCVLVQTYFNNPMEFKLPKGFYTIQVIYKNNVQVKKVICQ